MGFYGKVGKGHFAEGSIDSTVRKSVRSDVKPNAYI